MPELRIEYFYSVRSSFTYLGAARLNALARRHRATIEHFPMDLVKVIDAYNEVNDPRPADRSYAGARAFEKSPAREQYTRLEYRRWSERLGIPIKLDPKHHYGPRELPSGVVIAAQSRGLDVDRLSHDILQALWRDDRDIADEKVLAELIEGCGLDVDAHSLCREAMEPATRAILERNTSEAVKRGVFGSPFYIFRGEPFFGQDRLDFLDVVLARAVG